MSKVIHSHHHKPGRRQIDPTKIKKRSQMKVHQGSLETHILAGWSQDRLPTPSGFRSKGFENKVFACYREIMAPGAVGPKLQHEKKAKMVLILSGTGAVHVTPADSDKSAYSRLLPGHELVINPGDTYQFFTTAKAHLEMQISQESKYDANLIVLEEAKVLEIPSDLGQTTGIEEEDSEQASPVVVAPRRERNSKAQQQIWEKQAAAAIRNGTPVPEAPPGAQAGDFAAVVPGNTRIDPTDLAGRPLAGTNARPMTEAELMAEFGG